MNKSPLLLQSQQEGVYSITIGSWSDSTFNFNYGFEKTGSHGSIQPDTFQGIHITTVFSRGNSRADTSRYQTKMNLVSEIHAPNGVRITRLDTNRSVILPSLDGNKSSRFHLANAETFFSALDVGKSFQIKIEVV